MMTSAVRSWIKRQGEEFLRGMGIGKDQVILDFGCGEGHYAIPAARLVGEKGKIYALDKDSDTLEELAKVARQEGLGNIHPIHAETKTSLQDHSIDFVVCYDVMHPVSGGGWTEIKRDELRERFYSHPGDDSWFVVGREE